MVVVCLFWGSGAAVADTIVLKNGRRIAALSAVEVGGKIRYQTAAGELSLPKSIVDHIEKGGAVPGSPAAEAANLAITAPAMAESGISAEVASRTVHDGAVDTNYIAELEREARSGGKSANDRAAIAHHTAAEFAVAHGDLERGLEEERTALIYAPEQPVFLLDLAYAHLRRSEYKQAMEYVERARRVVPDSPDVGKLAGWAYYGMNKLDRAVDEWERVLKLHPDAEVQAALEKVKRDQREEEHYKENESMHFSMRYSGEAQPGLAHDILRTLEMHFSAIESELNFTPPDSIAVILYTQQAFADITRAPAWVGALNDGRIRVPVQGLTEVTPELSRVLKHELTHSFIQQKTRGHAPTWVQEGLAQWMEGKRSDENAAELVQIYEAKHADPLGALEGSWMNMPANAAAYAYAWALANIEYIVHVDGMSDVDRILDRIASGSSAEAALKGVLRSDYEELMFGTADYLRKTYGR